MAKKVNRPTNTGKVETRSFDKGLNEDITDYHLPPNMWTQARNATNNTGVGDIGDLSNEASNLLCSKAPYQIIGTIHIEADRFLVYSTDNTNSEIGQFFENTCKYKSLVNDPCLGFKDTNLIKGVAKENFDCTWQVYWADSLNPDRTMNIDEIPWIEICVDENNQPIPNPNPDYTPVGCITCTATEDLDCDAIRLAPLVKNPCLSIEATSTGGELNNGSYYVVAAYTINGVRVTDYSMPSNIASVFNHNDLSGALNIKIDDMDQSFDEFELVLATTVASQTGYYNIGNYSTRQKTIAIDNIQAYTQLSADYQASITLLNPIVDRSDAIYENANYLLRVGTYEKFDFNYQPLANQIESEWVSVEYPADYYREGGVNTGYMRDEVYSFFIRWVYDTGDKSPSFHIPGKYEAPTSSVFDNIINDDSKDLESSVDSYNLPPKKWRIYNTAQVNPPLIAPFDTTSDGGQIISTGKMAYWESSEKYDDDKANIWNASSNPIWGSTDPAFDLCGKPIRHHKFPASVVAGDNGRVNHFNQSGTKIRVMSVRFNNIKPPLDNQGNQIDTIVGYEILRGSRESNKSVFAKGMINDMLAYKLPYQESSNLSDWQGLYPNYPYNDIREDLTGYTLDSFLTESFNGYTDNDAPPALLTKTDRYSITFHSPDFELRRPYLNGTEIKLYQGLEGAPVGKFAEPSAHPEHVLFTDFAFAIGLITGLGFGLLGAGGKRSDTKSTPKIIDLGSEFGTDPMNLAPGLYQSYFLPPGTSWKGVSGGSSGYINASYKFSHYNHVGQLIDAINAGVGLTNGTYGILGSLGEAISGGGLGGYGEALDDGLQTGSGANSVTEFGDDKYGFIGYGRDWTQEAPANDYLPTTLQVAGGSGDFLFKFSQGFDQVLELMTTWSTKEQYALQYQSHCFYNQAILANTLDQDGNVTGPAAGLTRRRIEEQAYLGNATHNFSDKIINNNNRSTTVVLETFKGTSNPLPQLAGDDSKVTMSQAWNEYDAKKGEEFTGTTAKSYYAGVKQLNRNQYGQIESIIQVPVSTCKISRKINQTEPLFNGDIYIGRYTEKNTMLFYSTWLENEPDLTPLNYSLYPSVPYPRFGMNTQKYDSGSIVGAVMGGLAPPYPPGGPTLNVSPNAFYDLDPYLDPESNFSIPSILAQNGILVKRSAAMYLFNSGVRDFFVESEINVELRDWGNDPEQRHYDYKRYSDVSNLFDQLIIKSGNYNKYDTSLSVSFLYNNLTRWGFAHSLDYDPTKAEDCFSYRPNRLIYSLPQNESNSIKDFWKVFLPFNREDFKSRVSAVKPLNQNGALILFDNEAPKQFLGTDTLQLGSGNKVTIGDGGLFNKPLQSLASTDEPYEYGSCQNRLSVINTAAGVFWISQNQGKIFNLSGGMKEISSQNMKWWLSSYLPYSLTKDFPDFELTDNPVAGIGCQSIFDNENQVVYFTKKDYKLRTDIADTISYISGVNFLVNDRTPITLGDPAYFEDASWTLSYDPKVGQFISYHDWHPDLLMPSKGNFLTIKEDGIWKHNDRCDSYCNFYGKDYPFEVEYAVTTPQMVNTLRSIEYYMEAYKYADNCYDRFHVLDYNFDEAIIYNSEQCSGLLDLNLSPKNNAPEITTYPKINPSSISILFSKEEQKYRFNQFWDITADRGEFNPAAERMIFNTAANGYARELNAANLDYNKIATQRKKFRHYKNTVLLRRTVSGDRNMIVQLTNDKNLYSPR